MKKSLMALAVFAMCGVAYAAGPGDCPAGTIPGTGGASFTYNPAGGGNTAQCVVVGFPGGGGTGGAGGAGGTAVAGAIAGAAAVASPVTTIGNATTAFGPATSFSPSATIEKGAVTASGGSATGVRGDVTGNSGTIQGGNATGGNATGGNATGGSASSSSTGGSVTIADGAVRNTNSVSGVNTIADGAVRNSNSNVVSTGEQNTSVTTTGTVGNVSATVAEGAVQNTQNQTTTTTGTVGDVVNGSATSGNTQNITLNTFDPNSAETTRALGEAEIAVATINAQAARDIADRQAEALADAARQKIRNTPSVSGPPLTSSNDTCMGSASGSVNIPGFGVGVGKTYTDANCVMLKNSRELWNMGMKAAALALMCKDPDNREALEVTGYVCPDTERARQASAANATAAKPEYTDPIVRARLGLAPLK